MNFRSLDYLLREDGWFLKSVEGSHYHYEHNTKKGKVTVPRHSSKDIDKKTLNSILKQAGLK